MVNTLPELIEIMKKEHLCTFFVLPLIGLSRFNFGEGNFVNCYISNDLSKVFVQVHDIKVVPMDIKITCTTLHVKDGLKEKYGIPGAVLEFTIPELWNKDLQLFQKGLYSKMSPYAKDLIKKLSGLKDGVSKLDKIITDYRLLALDKSPYLKEYLEEALDTSLSPDSELMEPPAKEQFLIV